MRNPNNTGQDTSRRDFFKKTGKKALWVAPTVTVLMAAARQPLRAAGGYGRDCRNPNPGTQGGRSPCAPGIFQF